MSSFSASGPRWLAGAIALFIGATQAACTATPDEPAFEESEEDFGATQGAASTTVSQAAANSCTTSSVKGLSKQIIAEAQCMNADAFTKVPDLGNVSFGTSVFPYLEKPAKEKLVSGLKAKPGTSMTVNSMLRTVAQQYLLYRWYQTGRCGIGLAAKPGNSNHETGLAIDISQYSTWKGTLQARGFHWLGSADPVHFDYAGAGAKSYKGVDVKAFQRLWNRNHPGDKIDTDGIWGPQTEARMKKAPAGGFAKGATCGSSPQSEEIDAVLEATDDLAFDAAFDALDSDAATEPPILQIDDSTVEHAAQSEDPAADDLCATCFDAICSQDAYCCDTEWDDRCVSEGETLCAALCGAGAMTPL